MAEQNYDEVRKRLLSKEISDVENPNTVMDAVVTAGVPLAIGALGGQMGAAYKAAQSGISGMQEQQAKKKEKLLDYLSKMKTAQSDNNWKLENVDGKVVKVDSKTGNIVDTGFKPHQKDVSPSWQQAGGTENLTLFRKNPNDDR
jgi:Sec-independent protein translocase protein TatA